MPKSVQFWRKGCESLATNSKKGNMKIGLMAGVVGWACVVMPSVIAQGQETNTIELIKKLQQRIEELEQKVKVLEAQKPSLESTTQARTKELIEDLDLKVGKLTRQREADQKLAAEKSKT